MEKRADAVSSSWRVFRFVALGVVVTRILLQRIVGLFGSGSRPILPTDLDGRVVDFYPTLANHAAAPRREAELLPCIAPRLRVQDNLSVGWFKRREHQEQKSPGAH